MSSSESQSAQVFNVPNQLSAARLVISFVVFGATALGFYKTALVLFLIAAGTDWIDGWYARKYDQVTKLGRILDPFCDKILICGTYILLAIEMNDGFQWFEKIAGWMAVVVVGRELLVTVLRSLIEGSGGDFSAKWAGKLKMGFQCAAVVACYLALIYSASNSTLVPLWLRVAVVATVWISVWSTLHSGWLYVKSAKSVILEPTKAD